MGEIGQQDSYIVHGLCMSVLSAKMYLRFGSGLQGNLPGRAIGNDEAGCLRSIPPMIELIDY